MSLIKDFDKERQESLMQQRIADFFERYQPEDRGRASEFAGDFHTVVRAIYAEASEPANRQLMKLAEGLPFYGTINREAK